MAGPEEYAKWIVDNQDKQGTPEFDTVAQAYSASRKSGIDLQALQRDTLRRKAIEQQIATDPLSTGAQESAQEGVLPAWLAGNPGATVAERISAAPMTRFAAGAGAPAIGVGQLFANMTPAGPAVNQNIANFEQMKRAGGLEGPDVLGVTGSILGPAGFAAAKMIPSLPSWYARAAQSGAIGAVAGAVQPVTEGDYWTGKAGQVGGGALFGVLGQPVIDLASAAARPVASLIDRSLPGGANREAARLALAASKGRERQTIDALRNAPSGLTGGQAALGQGNYEFSALDMIARAQNPTAFGELIARQEASRLEKLAQMAGGATRETQESTIAAAKKWRDAETAFMRVRELEAANIGGVKTAQLQAKIAAARDDAAQAVEDVRRLVSAGQTAESVAQSGRGRLDAGVENAGNPPTAGNPRLAGKYGYGSELANLADTAASDSAAKSLQRGAEARFAEMQLGSLAQHGLHPLDPSAITGRINAVLSTPGDRGDLNTKVLGAVRDKIDEYAARNGGVLDARDLYDIRKQEINDIVQRLTKDLDASAKQRAAGLATGLKSYIDDAIVQAGGTGWKDYLNRYSEISKDIDRLKLGGIAMERYKQNPAAFLKVMGGDQPDLIARKLGGPGVRSFEQRMTPDEMNTLRGVEAEAARELELKRQGLAGAGAMGKYVSATEAERLRLPNVFSRPATVINKLLDVAYGRANEATIKSVSDLMMYPNQLAEVMRNTMTQDQRRATINALAQRGLFFNSAGAAQQQPSQ